MAVNAYIIIAGITGPSTSKTGAIDILSFSWGASNTSTYGTGASGKEAKAGRANLADLSIMKVLDATSPTLFSHCVSGDILATVQLLYDKPVGDKQQDYYVINLKDALITAIQQSGSSENPMESVTFAYQAIEIGYAPENDDGTLAAALRKGFDLETLSSSYAGPGVPS
jgi:type VI secretion system secreted protein Hcp